MDKMRQKIKQFEKMREETKVPMIVDPKHITQKDEQRAQKWAHGIISKHLDKVTRPEAPDNEVLVSKEVEPEEIDIRAIYPFKKMHWSIYKRRGMIHLVLVSGHRPLFVSSFVNI